MAASFSGSLAPAQDLETDNNAMRYANVLRGLAITHDLSERMPLSDGWGGPALARLVYFNDALGKAEDNGVIQEEFFGGVSIGWSLQRAAGTCAGGMDGCNAPLHI